MTARDAYESTAVGAVGTMTYRGSTSDDSEYERFALLVAELESMESEGLVRIESKHRESQTGMRHVDVVRFTRLK